MTTGHDFTTPAPDRRHDSGPFDIISDVHGCADELVALLARLGYRVTFTGTPRRAEVSPPEGRRAFFVGDLVDRGPRSPDALRIVMAMVRAGQAFCVAGNHDDKFRRWLEGRNVTISHGIETTIHQFAAESDGFKAEVAAFLEALPHHAWLDGGRLAIAHAGIRADMLGRVSDRTRRFCLYGDAPGTVDANGLAVRFHWAAHYRGDTAIVYGHTPIETPEWFNNTLCIDTGCCFGGAMTALRWPEREIVSEPARAVYAERKRAFGHPPIKPASD
ncbi:MAG: metallophosphoesterase [Hyphomicrobiaceae bacterium]